jgi:hypothetical protein
MTDEWRRVQLPDGKSFPVRAGSPLDAAFSGDDPPQIPMPLSLGVLGDLMWTRLPETRPYLAEHITREVADALEEDRELMLLVGSLVPDALWHPVMAPTLDAYPRTRDRVAAQLAVVREAYLTDDQDQTATQSALESYVFDYLRYPPYREIVEQVDPALAALLPPR